MWQWIQSNFGIIIIAVSFGISGLGWLFQQLKQAHEKKQAEQARQRAKLEGLRTGRVEAPATSGGSGSRPTGGGLAGGVEQAPRKRLEDLARRRQEEQQQRSSAKRDELEAQLRRRREAIEAQRRRQQEMQQQQRHPASQRQQGTQQPGRPQRQGSPAMRPEDRRGQPARQPPAKRTVEPTRAPVQQSVITDVIAAQGRQEDRPVQAPIAVGRTRRASPLTAGGFDLKQAVVMREIFDRPVGMRPPGDELF